MTDTMTPEEKIEFVRQQIKDIRAGHVDSISCPYCHKFAHRGQLCCRVLTGCVSAILYDEQVSDEIRLQDAIGAALVN